MMYLLSSRMVKPAYRGRSSVSCVFRRWIAATDSLFEGVKLRPGAVFPNGLLVGHQLDVGSLSLVLHGLAEDGVVHQFEKVLLKLIGGSLALLGVKPDIWLQPCRLEEGDDAMDSRQLHP